MIENCSQGMPLVKLLPAIHPFGRCQAGNSPSVVNPFAGNDLSQQQHLFTIQVPLLLDDPVAPAKGSARIDPSRSDDIFTSTIQRQLIDHAAQVSHGGNHLSETGFVGRQSPGAVADQEVLITRKLTDTKNLILMFLRGQDRGTRPDIPDADMSIVTRRQQALAIPGELGAEDPTGMRQRGTGAGAIGRIP
jgi:hypothetical protein